MAWRQVYFEPRIGQTRETIYFVGDKYSVSLASFCSVLCYRYLRLPLNASKHRKPLARDHKFRFIVLPIKGALFTVAFIAETMREF